MRSSLRAMDGWRSSRGHCVRWDATPQIDLNNPKLHDFALELSDAARRKDVAAVRGMLGDVVMNGGIMFSDIECIKQFAYPGKVVGSKLDAFARCLTTLPLEPSLRADAFPDVAVLHYAPGIELEARFMELYRLPYLLWIGYVGRRDMADALPTVTARTLEARRVSGTRHGPLPSDVDLRSELAAAKNVFGWLKVCIDTEGNVTSAHLREATSPRVGRLFAKAAAEWKFQPFTLDTRALPVCSMMLMVYPPETGPNKPDDKETLPLPLPPGPEELTIVPSSVLGPRVAGNAKIVPDDEDKTMIHQKGWGRLVSAFQLCIDTQGHVMRVQMVRSSGVPRYDEKVMNGMKQWAYKPFLDEGKAVSVCTSVRFVYTQR